MNVVNVKLSDILPYDKNAKKHDKKQINNVAQSIKKYGFVQPLVIDKDNVIVIGHCRALAAKQLDIKEVPCVRVDELTDEQVKALRLVDNKSNESDWDIDLLKQELEEIDLSAFEFDWGIVADIEPTDKEVDEGAVEDNTNSPMELIVIFDNKNTFRKIEQQIRDVVDSANLQAKVRMWDGSNESE